MPLVTLPDGSQKRFDSAVSVAQIAAAIGAGLAKAALAGKVDGVLVDTSTLVDHDARVSIVTDRDPEGLEILRHSTAHLLANAVQELYPDAQVTIGPVIEDGFYYDFAYKRPFTTEDLATIEKRMAEIAARDLPVHRRVLPRDAAVAHFRAIGEQYKAEIIAAIPPDQPISLYGQGDWEDLCRGPHVPSTGTLRAFKLMKVAGAYWRGDSRNEMLQRIYGTAWANDKQLKEYLTRLEEAEKRDHRRIGKELDLFHLQEEAPGAVFWHPKGWALFQQLIAYMRERQGAAGFQEVNTPEIMDRELWVRSGHIETFGENMYMTETPDERVFAIKPMICPGHIQVFSQGLRRYRVLPLRL
ncbi:MAG: threonine--tRNA ligase, partial [Steroidobacteraceae bacterium]